MYADKIKWGIIGCGNVTEQKSGPAFQKVTNSELVAVMRRNGELAKDYAQRHGVKKWYDDAEKLINDPEVNAIYIATPPDSHCNYTLQALKAGKAVYVEKPMANSYTECQQMVEVAEENNVPLFVAYYRRALPLFKKVKEIMENGEIGKPLSVNIRFFRPPLVTDMNKENLPWRVIPEIAGGGHFVDLGAHQFDILNFYFGAITNVHGKATNFADLYPAEDNVIAQWEHESGVLGVGSWCFVAGQTSNKDHIEIVGSKGRIEFSTFQFKPVIVRNDSGEKEYYFEKPEHVEQYFIQSIVEELTGGRKSSASLKSAVNTTRVMENILKGYYQK
ncbi:Gfo/Idh/MocA family oxidoreductase [Prolixibacteraceae bacterium JC049]|nr:Gfo/Idh/MocA family oxidoreductase [Prolixibacteraceae bacterium JC049]